jgi:hypothetical protein
MAVTFDLLKQTILSSATNTINWTGISTSYTTLYMNMTTIGTSTSTTFGINAVNSTSTNQTAFSGAGTTVYQTRLSGSGTYNPYVGNALPYSFNNPLGAEFYFINYKQLTSGQYQNMLSFLGAHNEMTLISFGQPTGDAAASTITLNTISNQFEIGSIFSLYGFLGA